ncbi:MAG: circularly permuted type 2 ATP-grasp protein, partial [Chthoniobacteraceae bacterium]
MPAAARAPSLTSLDGEMRWHEVTDRDGRPRPVFDRLLSDISHLSTSNLRHLGDRMEATLREMGVTFDLIRDSPWGRQPWTCDLLPHVFSPADWERIVRGFRQRMRAFEMFLEDVYGAREILRAGAVPIQAVLGSVHYQYAAVGLPRPRGSFLHLCGLCVCRAPDGTWQVKDHHYGHATGISFMMQNRRALARVVPELFQDTPVLPLAEVPLAVMERLRETAHPFGADPTVVLLAPGGAGGISNKQSFLARRMGIPLVAGGDLLVLEDCVYLKTVRGLERVEVIFNRVPDAWLDPLVFRSGSSLGVPGLIQCVRRGTVTLVNAVGSQIADDRSLLPFAGAIIRFYLGEAPVLPGVQTHWLGDIDQREMVLDDLAAYRISRTTRNDGSDVWETAVNTDDEATRTEIRRCASSFVAQPRDEGALTLCYERGMPVHHPQDHIVFGVRTGDNFDVFPGALTRVFTGGISSEGLGFGWTTKDSWVLSDPKTDALLPPMVRRTALLGLPPRQVTSRVAESFYWLGRDLERAYHQA